MKYKIKKTEILNLAMIQTDKQSQIPREILDWVFPEVWASRVPGKSKNAEPVKMNLKPGAGPVRIKKNLWNKRIEKKKNQ